MNNPRSFLFCAVFLFLLIVYAVIVVPFLMSDSALASRALDAVIAVAPVLTGDVAVIGNYTPPALAVAMTALAPPRSSTKLFWGSIILIAVTYLAYVHATIFLSSGRGEAFLALDRDLAHTKSTVMPLVEGVRTFCLVSVAGLLGLKLNKNV